MKDKKTEKSGCLPSAGFIICIFVILGILFLFIPLFTCDGVWQLNMTAVGARGKDIYVAITGANTEREALGLPPIWPSDAPPYTNHLTGKVECFNFTNSTDYFDYIFDRPNLGTENHSPMVAGFDFGKLAGGGVRPHTGAGPLTAENNIWAIAKNVTDQTEDVIPFLITRNLDTECLSATILDLPNVHKIPLGRTWKTPFNRKGAVIIRKGGGMFKVSARYATPLVIYNRQSFDANANSKYPLKYLTPDKEVVPVGKIVEPSVGRSIVEHKVFPWVVAFCVILVLVPLVGYLTQRKNKGSSDS